MTHTVEEDPGLWLLEFLPRLGLMMLVQVLTGVGTLMITRSSIPQQQKLPVCLAMTAALSWMSSHIFNPRTHLLGCMICGVAMAFTTPLQAIAWIERSSEKGDITDDKTIVLRIAIPAAIPSSRHQPEDPRVQLMRGCMYLGIASGMKHFFRYALDKGGIILDAIALCSILCGATGTLNMTAATLGFLGVRSPSPFRNPLLATSASEFWSGRWNAAISDSLRIGVYEPFLKRSYSRPTATMACFAVSGLAHEVILRYANVQTSRGEWMAFFLLCGFTTILDRGIARIGWGSGLLRRLFGIAVLVVPFHCLFVPVTIRTGLAEAGINALGTGEVLGKHFIKQLFS